jgi:7-carboxy-7-deazaguanine synthase
MTGEEIVQEVYTRLRHGPKWIVFSGGNPALLQLDEVVRELQYIGYKIMVETQGTVTSPWLGMVNELCVSPKPPSSGNVTSIETLDKFLGKLWMSLPPTVITKELAYLKIPIFDYHDLIYARAIHRQFPEFEMFLSVGNKDPMLPTVGNNAQGDPNFPVNTQELLRSLKWLMEEVIEDPEMRDVRVLPQLHVLAWGNERGR